MKRKEKKTLIDTAKEDFAIVDDLKLRATLSLFTDKYNEKIREMIYRVYNDPDLLSSYRALRESGIYEKGGKSKVHRKILEFPNAYIYDFVDRALTPTYGPNWIKDRRALRHELVRPFWVVKKI